MLRKLETVEKALYQNSQDRRARRTELVNVIGDLAGLLPMPTDGKATATPAERAAAEKRGNGAGSQAA